MVTQLAETGVLIPDGTKEKEQSVFEAGVRVQPEPKGSSGTDIFGGYFSEDYLSILQGTQGAKIWDEMRRSESQVAMLLNSVINSIKAAVWEFEPYEESDEFQKHSDFVQFNIFEGIDWEQFLHEALTCLSFGYSLFETVHGVVFNHPKYGTFNSLKALGFRSQKTVERWNLDPKTGAIITVEQWAQGDLSRSVKMDGAFLLPIVCNKEGDNYEGISALRTSYGPWKRKNLYLKLIAIGLEKYAVGTPMGTVPQGKEKSPELDEFKKILSSFVSHESAYLTKPQGWEVEILQNEFDASKVKEILLFENTEMINSFVANFLALGTNGNGGAFALASDLSDFFLNGIRAYANLICTAINRKISPDLVKLNFGAQPGYPKLKYSGIGDKAGKELAEIFKTLVDGKILDPDKPMKTYARKQFGFPKADETYVAPALPAPTLSERVKLAEDDYKKKFNKAKDSIKDLMRENLLSIYDGLKKSLERNYNAAGPTTKIKAAVGLEAPGEPAYRQALRDELALNASKSLDWARKQVPSKKNFKLVEFLDDAIRLAAGYYDALPPKVKNIVQAQADLIAQSQVADLEKAVYFQFTSSAGTSDDITAILKDIDDKVLPTLEGTGNGPGMSIDAAAGDALAQVLQQSAMEFFFAPEVLDEIESFTFVNEDPVSEICQELNGTTFATNDPDLDRYGPPLHHNCKSRLVPNLKGAKDNPEIDRGGLSLSKKALKSVTLGERQKLFSN